MLSGLFFPLVVDVCQRKDVLEKEGLFEKPVGGAWTRERLLTVWSVMTSGQVLAGWLLSAVS